MAPKQDPKPKFQEGNYPDTHRFNGPVNPHDQRRVARLGPLGDGGPPAAQKLNGCRVFFSL